MGFTSPMKIEGFRMSLPSTADVHTLGLYLDLMKQVLTDTIYIDDPMSNLVVYRPKSTTPSWKRMVIRALGKLLAAYEMTIVEPNQRLDAASRERIRAEGRDWPARAHTMVGMKRLDNLQFCVDSVLRNGVPGDLIETGVWRGGACIFMRAILKAYGSDERCVWVADSFRGLPPPDEAKYAADAKDVWHTFEALSVSREQVESNFKRYGLLDDRVHFLEGWFKDTLPSAPINKLAVIRLDGDMYESTTQALEALYHRLSIGGFLIVDDFCLAPCAQAVHDFRDQHGISDQICDIDGVGSFWQRSS